ncbi:MAG: nitroreductase [Kiloniellaceae bacterium]
MDVLEAITTRRSVYGFAEQCPDLGLVRTALDAAVLAPNHYKTRPWRFAVFSGKGRHRLSQALGAAAARLDRPVERAKEKPYTSPIQVVAGVRPLLDHPKVVAHEEMLAVGAAIQNFMLALHAHGVGSIWTTGALADSDEVKRLVGWTEPDDRVVGMVYVGYADAAKAIPQRTPCSHAQFTTWIS